MNLQSLTALYHNTVKDAEQSLLEKLADYFGAKSIAFYGDQEYNDEDYYNDLGSVEIDGKSLRSDSEMANKVYRLLFDKDFVPEYEGEEDWERWAEIKEFFMSNLPSFIKEKTTKYTKP
jgi:hypothetical protein